MTEQMWCEPETCKVLGEMLAEILLIPPVHARQILGLYLQQQQQQDGNVHLV
jgi:hypothetical protein